MLLSGEGLYEGDYVNGRRHGRGRMWSPSGAVYDGRWRDDLKHGYGKEALGGGGLYEGRFVNGSRHGHGKLTYPNKDKYEGAWLNNSKHGFGTFQWHTGASYAGQWKYGSMHGQGTFKFADGCTYTGHYADNQRHGRGIYCFADGSFFEGEYHEGVADGRGTRTYADGTAEVGRWRAGEPVGEATRFSVDHKTAWRLLDGKVTGPVSLAMADVIAQCAFRKAPLRLVRAVRQKMAAVRLAGERRRVGNQMGGVLRAPTPELIDDQSQISMTDRGPGIARSTPTTGRSVQAASSPPAASPPAKPTAATAVVIASPLRLLAGNCPLSERPAWSGVLDIRPQRGARIKALANKALEREIEGLLKEERARP